MAIDWSGFEDDLKDALDGAQRKTNDDLAARAASVTRLTDDEVKMLFPTPGDVEKLKNLMQIVKSAGDMNSKQNSLVANIESLSGTVLTLLAKFA